MPGDRWLPAARTALWAVGLAAAAGIVVLGLTDDRIEGHRVSAVLSAVAGLAFLISGLIAWCVAGSISTATA